MSERCCYNCNNLIPWATTECPHCGQEYDLQGSTGPKEAFTPPAKDEASSKGGKTASKTQEKPAAGKKPPAKKRGKNPSAADSKGGKKKNARPSSTRHNTPEAAPVDQPAPVAAEAAPPPAPNGNGNGNGNGVMPEQHETTFRRLSKAGMLTEWTVEDPDKETVKTIDHLMLRKFITVSGKKERMKNGGEGPIHCKLTEKGQEWIAAHNWRGRS